MRRQMKRPIHSIQRFILRRDTAVLFSGLVFFLTLGSSSGQAPAPTPNFSANIGALVKSVAAGSEPSAGEVRKLDNAIISIEDEGLGGTPGEIPAVGPEAEKKIYILKMQSRTDQAKELLELQRNLLRNQLMVLRVLGIIGKHQEVMGQRLSRTENLNRELLTGLRDVDHGVDTARTDIASTLTETTDLSEMTEELTVAVEDMQKQLEDLETGLSGLQETADETLEEISNIEEGDDQ